VKITGGL